MWFGEEQRENIIKITCLKDSGLHLQNINNYYTVNSEHN